MLELEDHNKALKGGKQLEDEFMDSLFLILKESQLYKIRQFLQPYKLLS